MQKTYAPAYSSHGVDARKTHLFDTQEEKILCGADSRFPHLFFNVGTTDYTDIENQYFNDPDGYGCLACRKVYEKLSKDSPALANNLKCV